jgi:Icc-related predicted phosphoesterase
MANEELMLIGDSHGKLDEYWKLLQGFEGESIQIGDFGFKKHHEWHMKNIDSDKHKVLFGNHDSTDFLDAPHSLGNWSYCEERKLMTVRGAWSVDRVSRTEGVDWWSNEELNYGEFLEVLDVYIEKKPNVVVTHDCPHIIRQTLFGITQKSTTTNGLQGMFDFHQPKLWVFGHHHESKDVIIKGTRFICLAELETLILSKEV